MLAIATLDLRSNKGDVARTFKVISSHELVSLRTLGLCWYANHILTGVRISALALAPQVLV